MADTKMPDELAPGDRMVVRQGMATAALEVRGLRLTIDGMVVRFHDGTSVTITDLDMPVEVVL